MLQVIRADGEFDPKVEPDLSHEDLLRMHRYMLTVRRFNEKGMSLQRQGRIGFFMESTGQEACQIGMSYCLGTNDWAFPSYRDPGTCLVRGVPLSALFDQIMGNSADENKGRNMPVHWGFAKWKMISMSSPIGSKLLHAVGVAYASKFRGEKSIALVSFGEGATSQGEFHAALNFAGVWKTPVVFFCENNQYAISLPTRRSTASESIAIKAEAYGFDGVQIDGNDVLAVYKATKSAIDKARSGGGPTLIEAVTYRMGGHSTSDDPSIYRSQEEVEMWRRRDPITRFTAYLMKKGALTEQASQKIMAEIDAEMARVVKEREAIPPPDPSTLFTEVYSEMPWHIREEAEEFMANEADRGQKGGE
ncbi:MAG TPA: pyruvate dehydrogenase (acetyl-transferring) E1 component subunit alpha [Nitrososphaerales archaeon]|nr:pyruvate dehydrogenase (acetyl-transferring) E1 component subunit alpha [Nitrososphaerales archaeon]HUK74212.1 pyruvate dehydrogenase (acetyl-transferring) E1 component subunit alpha [Nitrososphaerales archaeon]